jgi:predicted DNA-binding transcriptional regulator YafY
MVETSARLLRLLSLFQGRRYWSGHDLADRLEVTPRTLRRDVDKLRSLGYPIHSSAGIEGGYQLGAGSTMPPLLLDDEEAVAVALGVRAAATGAIEGIEEASMRALSKIDQLLPPRLGRRVAALQSMIVTATARVHVDAKTLTAIAGACRDNESLRFRYSDYSGKTTARSVEPHRLVHTGRRWYLVAWDTDRADWRTFRVDRMEPRVTTGARFVPREPPAKDLAAYIAKGAWNAPRCRARVKLFAAAEVIIERWPPSAGMVEPIDDQSCSFEMGASTYENLATYLVMFGVDFEVAGPPELIEEIQRLSARLRRSIDPSARAH